MVRLNRKHMKVSWEFALALRLPSGPFREPPGVVMDSNDLLLNVRPDVDSNRLLLPSEGPDVQHVIDQLGYCLVEGVVDNDRVEYPLGRSCWDCPDLLLHFKMTPNPEREGEPRYADFSTDTSE
jgi:hypothetical protein